MANGQLYAKLQREKKNCAAALDTEFVWKEIKILRNKNIVVFGFPYTCYQVFVGNTWLVAYWWHKHKFIL